MTTGEWIFGFLQLGAYAFVVLGTLLVLALIVERLICD